MENYEIIELNDAELEQLEACGCGCNGGAGQGSGDGTINIS